MLEREWGLQSQWVWNSSVFFRGRGVGWEHKSGTFILGEGMPEHTGEESTEVWKKEEISSIGGPRSRPGCDRGQRDSSPGWVQGLSNLRGHQNHLRVPFTHTWGLGPHNPWVLTMLTGAGPGNLHLSRSSSSDVCSQQMMPDSGEMWLLGPRREETLLFATTGRTTIYSPELRSPERRGKQAIITNAPYVKVTANPVFQILELYNFMP